MGDDEVIRQPVHDGRRREDGGLHLLAHAAGVGLEHHEDGLAGGLALREGLVEVRMVLQRRVARGSRIVPGCCLRGAAGGERQRRAVHRGDEARDALQRGAEEAGDEVEGEGNADYRRDVPAPADAVGGSVVAGAEHPEEVQAQEQGEDCPRGDEAQAGDDRSTRRCCRGTSWRRPA